jgi:precorrin isomerase
VLDLKNITIDRINQNKRINSNFVRMKNLMDVKMASYLRYLGTKNAINRASDYHYLVLAVTDSTAPVNGIDYIHPTVKPVVDYATAVITKGLVPNGEVNFDFVADTESDAEAARQASEMVATVINEQNDPHFILERWVMDAAMHKNGMMMIMPVREAITRYVETQGTLDQLRAFEQQAADSGLTALRQTRRRVSVDLEAVMAEVQQLLGDFRQEQVQGMIDQTIESLGEEQDLEAMMAEMQATGAEGEQDILNDAITRNTIYMAKYKLTGYNLLIKFNPIAQHY